jgi:hypothetical protein
MRDALMLSARVPFAGFYGSIWSEEIDHIQEMEFDDEYRLAEQYPRLAAIPQRERDMQRLYDVLCFDAASYGLMHDAIADAYTDAFAYWLWESLDLGSDPVEYKYEEMTSPKFYNFETDRIFAKFPERIFQAIIDQLGPEEVAAQFKEMFTSRSGFCSFYDNTPPEKPLAEWDHNELYALLEAWVAHVMRKDRPPRVRTRLHPFRAADGRGLHRGERQHRLGQGGAGGGRHRRRLDRGAGRLRSDVRAAHAALPVHAGSPVSTVT